MKKHVAVFILSLLCCVGCSTQRCLQKRTDRLVEKLHTESDTIYKYWVAFSDCNLLWYHSGDYIHSFLVKPYSIKKQNPIPAENLTTDNDTLYKYFDFSFNKEVQCFDNTLDGAYLVIYIKNSKPMSSGIDVKCLLSNRYSPNTFPYRLQYVFSKIWRPVDFDFEKMYSEEVTE